MSSSDEGSFPIPYFDTPASSPERSRPDDSEEDLYSFHWPLPADSPLRRARARGRPHEPTTMPTPSSGSTGPSAPAEDTKPSHDNLFGIQRQHMPRAVQSLFMREDIILFKPCRQAKAKETAVETNETKTETNEPKAAESINTRKATPPPASQRCIACELDIPPLWLTTIVLFAMQRATGEFFLAVKQQGPDTPEYLIIFYETASSIVMFLLWIISAICAFIFTLIYLDRVAIIKFSEEKQPGTNYVYPHWYSLFHIFLATTPHLRTYLPLLAWQVTTYLTLLSSSLKSYLSFVWRHDRHQSVVGATTATNPSRPASAHSTPSTPGQSCS
ncbi:hypothetical protein GE09DRAFT_283661 [Coniochaeta sp. 2T2.1]|nr:hypothetical protein GE09DRAFT_283661 [Coniochaeta sp. 2T2.1]